jgi:TP901 family phage tail tape measure protein
MATNKVEYVLSLSDRISNKLFHIGASSDQAVNKLSKLATQSSVADKLFNGMAKSAGTVKAKLDALRSEKEWIPASNIATIQKYNSEIDKLEKELTQINNVGVSKFKQNLSSLFDNVPFANVFTNPLAQAGAALYGAGKMSMDFEQGMAKINTTAQLSETELTKLERKLMDIGKEAKTNKMGAVPDAFEKILSQTGDVDLSLDILKTSLKGAKGGFTESEVTAAALAQSLSLIGKENTNAQEVMDTFFAAKRVGAGEFKDFANYLPGLIAGGKSLGINFKETAGTFAYMTGKGFSAEKSATLMENAFSAMNKVDIQKNFKDAGINIFDEKGSVRSITSIFGDLNTKMAGMSDEGKSNFLAKMGLTDKEARSAFTVLASDMDKLNGSINSVKNSQGETQKAFDKSATSADVFNSIINSGFTIAKKLGGVVVGLLAPVFEGLSFILGVAANTVEWLFNGMADGNPWVWALVGSVTALTVIYKSNVWWLKLTEMWTKRKLVGDKLMVFWNNNLAIAQQIATNATWLFNAALNANPIFLIITGVGLLAGALYGLSKAFSSTSAAEKLNGEIKDRVFEKTVDQSVALDLLKSSYDKSKQGSDEFNKSLKELEAMQPGIVEKYQLQEKALGGINAAYSEMVANIQEVAEAEVEKEMMKESMKREMQLKKDGPTAFQKVLGWTSPGYDADYMNKIEIAKEQKDQNYLSFKMANRSLKEKKNKDAQSKIGSGSEVNLGKTPEVSLNLNTEAGINEKLKVLREQKELEDIGSKKYVSLGKEISKLEKRLGRKGSSSSRGVDSANESIVSGGQKSVVNNFSFRSMVENMTIKGNEFKEALGDLEEKTLDSLLRVIAMAGQTAG